MLFELSPRNVVETEVVIIGGGIVGLAAAYYLAKRRRKVAVLERRTFGWEGTGRTAGGVRQQGRDLRELPLAMASVDLWAKLEEELGARMHYRRTGNIFVAMTEEEIAAFGQAADQERSLGLRVEVIGNDRLKRMVPALSDRCIGGKYCPTDGIAEPRHVVDAFVNASQRLGVQLFPGTEALDFVVEGGRVISVVTEHGEFRPRVTVNAVGPWAPVLAMRIGVVLPIWAARSQLLEIEPTQPLFQEFLVFPSGGLYCRPTIEGYIHVGPLARVTPSDVGYPSALVPARVSVPERLALTIPELKGAPVRRAWSGLTDVTPDALPIVGPVPGLSDYLVAAGFNGQGFCLGPIVGKLLSEQIIDGTPSIPLEAFSLARFAS